jgi:hypothetical protein
MLAVDGDLVLGWYMHDGAFALGAPGIASLSSVQTGQFTSVDSSALALQPLSSDSSGTAWIVNANTGVGSQELRLLRFTGNAVERLAAIESPFRSTFTAESFGDEIVVIGGVESPNTPLAPVRTTVMRLTVRSPTNEASDPASCYLR